MPLSNKKKKVLQSVAKGSCGKLKPRVIISAFEHAGAKIIKEEKGLEATLMQFNERTTVIGRPAHETTGDSASSYQTKKMAQELLDHNNST